MNNPYGAPEITVQELAQMREREPGRLVVLDVRETFEISLASLPGDDVRMAPLSELSTRGLSALPPEVTDRAQPLAVLCHHGIRSAQVTVWLLQQGWTDVRSVAGGIDRYAQEVDPSVGAYE